VVGVFHPKWEERPVMLVELHEGAAATAEEVNAWLEPRVVKWWLPDRIFFGAVPLSATGKIDKKAIRERYKSALQG
jgi:3-(methylthio)propionyl---CoA ligase